METLNKMRGKTKISTIALVLVLTFAATLVALPATAQGEVTKKTYAFIGAIPNPVGVNQEVLLHVGIPQQLQRVGLGWENLTVTVERPDGTNETLGPFTTDATGGTGTIYVPSQVGTHYLQTHFPEQKNPARLTDWATGVVIPRGAVMLASDSEKLALIVQQEPVERHPGFPLPTDYWTRPIDAQLRDWSSISGSWLGYFFFEEQLAGVYHPYNDYAPEAPHILWTKPHTIGGLAGGEMGGHAFDCGDAYEGKWGGPLIIAGKLYYQTGPYDRPRVYHCVDLHTGEELWSKTFLDNATISFGQLFYWDSYNYHAVFPYLWVTDGSTWYAFDPYTGEWRFTIRNVPSGTTLRGPRGEIYRLQVNLRRGWMALWNMSAVISMAGSWGSAAHLRTHNGDRARAWSWNVTIPTGLPGSVNMIFYDDVMLGYQPGDPFDAWAVSLKPESRGDLLFNRTYAAPPGNASIDIGRVSQEDRVWTMWCKQHRTHYGYSLDDGEPLWGPTESEYYLGIYETWSIIAYGKLYTHGMKGTVDCYDVKNGTLLWTYESTDPYTEILWSNNWPIRVDFITDGKIYLRHSEHSPIDPKPRSAPYTCLNATTGDVIWRIDGLFRGSDWGGRAIIGDSIIATQDTYDQRVYAIGKGPSATTVTAPDMGVQLGSSVVIRGTVMDVSPGTNDPAIKLRFPNGVPAIADEDMSEWMLYVYKQFPHPADAVGVPVTLDAVDQNGTWIHIDTVTSDASGSFSYMWTPPDEGPYTIIATFMGSKSYYASYAATALGVGPTPPEPIEPAVQEDITALTPILYGTIAAVVVAIVIGIANLYALRKRK